MSGEIYQFPTADHIVSLSGSRFGQHRGGLELVHGKAVLNRPSDPEKK